MGPSQTAVLTRVTGPEDKIVNQWLYKHIVRLHQRLRERLLQRHQRHVSFGDLFADRWKTAAHLGFGTGTSCYDNVLVLGTVTVGRNCWIGPNVILDGSGGLAIGDNCSISAGSQIYTHNTVKWATTMGAIGPERRSTRIGSGVYIGPNAIIAMGVTIGDRAIIGAMSFVSSDVPPGAKAWGVPARVQDAGQGRSHRSPSNDRNAEM